LRHGDIADTRIVKRQTCEQTFRRNRMISISSRAQIKDGHETSL
jgi:hypothetical protein